MSSKYADQSIFTSKGLTESISDAEIKEVYALRKKGISVTIKEREHLLELQRRYFRIRKAHQTKELGPEKAKVTSKKTSHAKLQRYYFKVARAHIEKKAARKTEVDEAIEQYKRITGI